MICKQRLRETASHGGRMRFVLNNLTAVRRKTGIGHYVTELARCLRDQHPAHQFVTFPGRWVEAGVQAWERVQRSLRFTKDADSTHKAWDRPLRHWLNARARAAAAWHFRTFWSAKAFDLYH